MGEIVPVSKRKAQQFSNSNIIKSHEFIESCPIILVTNFNIGLMRFKKEIRAHTYITTH
jgi:hypothetical protein